jgi:hypothetical protein
LKTCAPSRIVLLLAESVDAPTPLKNSEGEAGRFLRNNPYYVGSVFEVSGSKAGKERIPASAARQPAAAATQPWLLAG